MTNRRLLYLLPWVLAATVPAGAQAMDLIIKQRQSFDRGDGQATSKEATEYSAGNKRVTDSADSRFIVDLDARTVTLCSKASRTYYTRSFDEVREQVESGRKRLAAMSEQTRKMVEEMMGGGEVSVAPTGKQEKIAGYTAREYAVQSPRVTGAMWVTEEIDDPLARRAAEAMADAVGGSGGPSGALTTALGKVKGMPLRTRITMKNGPASVTTINEVTEVIKATPPADVLTVPAGFTKQEAPSLKPSAPKVVPQRPVKP